MNEESIPVTNTYYQHVANTLLRALTNNHSEELKNAFSQLRLMEPSEYDYLINAMAEIRKPKRDLI